VAALTKKCPPKAGIPQRQISAEEIVDRLHLRPGQRRRAHCRRGYALRAFDIDITYINDYGFPAYRGAPCGTPTLSD